MKNKILQFYLLVFVFGFIYTTTAMFASSWFYSFGWLIGLLLIGAFVALYPLQGLHRVVGCILQNFAFFLPIKVFMTLHELDVIHLAVFEQLDAMKILGQLFLIIGVYLCSFVLFYILFRRRWDHQQQLRVVK